MAIMRYKVIRNYSNLPSIIIHKRGSDITSTIKKGANDLRITAVCALITHADLRKCVRIRRT